MKIIHGVFFIERFFSRGSFFDYVNAPLFDYLDSGGTLETIDIPDPIKHYIRKLRDRWSRKYEVKYIPFTVGIDEESGVADVAVVHPKDHFNRKIGNKIVTGRIKRMLGKIREPYNPIPDHMYVP